MKKILVRCGMLPYENITAEEMLRKDRTGSNNGNLLYQYSVIKTLMTKNTEIYSDGYQINSDNANYINENYDAYVLPLADAFREDFQVNLVNYTKLIKKLKIPVYVIGVGLRANYEPELENGFIFDENVKEFVKAVLEKSNIIGVRGQITADYLKTLGFIEEKDYTVIGCPSLFTYGGDLKIKPLNLKEESRIAINASVKSSQDTMVFLENISKQYKDHYFIPQLYTELFLTYMGGPAIKDTVVEYPANILNTYYKGGRVKFFLNVPTWYKFMRTVDFSIGSRFHGNVAAIVNGIPSLTLILDARMRELASYHKLPSVVANRLKSNMDLAQIIENIDLNSPEIDHKNRFLHYIKFLGINGLDNIYSNFEGTRFNELVQSIDFSQAVEPLTNLEQLEIISRLEKGHSIREKNFEEYLIRLASRNNSKIYELENELEQLKGHSENFSIK